jgi:hypothetical protein
MIVVHVRFLSIVMIHIVAVLLTVLAEIILFNSLLCATFSLKADLRKITPSIQMALHKA